MRSGSGPMSSPSNRGLRGDVRVVSLTPGVAVA
jgi:hypothetical protein